MTKTLRRPKVLCGEEGECCPGLGTRLLVAFVAGSAEIWATWLISKLDPAAVEDTFDAQDPA